jgi:hypothetical protein
MLASLKHKAAAGAVATALLAGAGVAYAATNGSNAPTPAKSRANFVADRNAFLDDVAKRLHVTRSQLEAALKGAATDRIDAAVAAGRLTKAQGDAIKQRIQQGGGPFPGPFFFGPQHAGPGSFLGGRGFRLGFGPGKSLDAAAHYLGVTDAQLASQLRSGKSLAQIAKDKGKSVDGLKQAVRSAVQAQVDADVKAGRMTAAQRTGFMKAFGQSLDNLVNRTPPAPPFFRHP